MDDVYPFVWGNFSDAGYVTLYAEDAHGIGRSLREFSFCLRCRNLYLPVEGVPEATDGSLHPDPIQGDREEALQPVELPWLGPPPQGAPPRFPSPYGCSELAPVQSRVHAGLFGRAAVPADAPVAALPRRHQPGQSGRRRPLQSSQVYIRRGWDWRRWREKEFQGNSKTPWSL